MFNLQKPQSARPTTSQKAFLEKGKSNPQANNEQGDGVRPDQPEKCVFQLLGKVDRLRMPESENKAAACRKEMDPRPSADAEWSGGLAPSKCRVKAGRPSPGELGPRGTGPDLLSEGRVISLPQGLSGDEFLPLGLRFCVSHNHLALSTFNASPLDPLNDLG